MVGLETLRTRKLRAAAKAKLGNCYEAVQILENQYGMKFGNSNVYEERNAPVFIFAAGWRSGSTLLQRLIMSKNGAFVWGEPFEQEALIVRMGEAIRALAFGMSPKHKFFSEKCDPAALSQRWTATIAPDVSRLREAYRALFLTLFDPRDYTEVCQRWGVKTVRVSPQYWYLFRWLFPEAKGIFLVRNPYDAYASFRGKAFFHEWPHRPVVGPREFARCWADSVSYFPSQGEKNTMIVRYESMIEEPGVILAIEKFLNLSINRAVLTQKLGSSENNFDELNLIERQIFRHFVHKSAEKYGY